MPLRTGRPHAEASGERRGRVAVGNDRSRRPQANRSLVRRSAALLGTGGEASGGYAGLGAQSRRSPSPQGPVRAGAGVCVRARRPASRIRFLAGVVLHASANVCRAAPVAAARRSTDPQVGVMLTLNQIRYGRFNSASLRKCLAYCFKEGKPYRVRFGPIRGMRLYYDRSVNFHAILGLWDAEEYAFLQRVLTAGEYLRDRMVVADVGANLGIFSLWFTRLLDGREHQVFAFEPAPDTLVKLRSNVALNGVRSIQVVPAACADREGSAEFFVGFHHHVSSLLKEWAHSETPAHVGSVQVPTTTLDAFFHAMGQEGPDFIKMDIEGGGVLALKGCGAILSTKRPLLWVESHTPAEDRAISDAITAHSYRAYRFTNRRPVTRPLQTHPDPDRVWGTLLLYHEDTHSRVGRAHDWTDRDRDDQAVVS